MVNKWLKFNQLLFPQKCMLCATMDGGALGICQPCGDALPWHNTIPQCPQCALPSIDSNVCGHCLTAPPAFDRIHALFRYEYPIDAMLQRYKYQHLLTMAALFGEMMMTELPRANLPDLIIPMPLHPQRLKERSFNQSLEIARIIANRLDIRLAAQSCSRTRNTPPQASLPMKERTKNMKDAFACNENLSGLHIAVVDDVMTTGASLNALAKTLKKAGAASVECWVVARTLPR
ncbi:phosphoribosyltransferase [Methylovorus sp. MM2]|uniref:ComF family protein n=1 Tax=Methylovorus sp. MM2 TaxID=1848038 RepID=UPI0007E0E392|nr:ComF family protein [Methylovorus sp. MM2]OAM51430.1 phosphoribosyltransferase [Methylovorus sp. MM2]